MIGPALFMVTVIVPEMRDAIAHYTGQWGFSLAEDGMHVSGHRWVEISTPGGMRVRLAEARDDAERAVIGRQAAGRVAFFLESGDLDTDVERLRSNGVAILEPERHEAYGRVVVLADKFGNRWDLIQPNKQGAP
ncbi:VOC family protein [Sphingomonas sp. CCH13-B11]|uniref:VOC family protein n=2 Tax=Sphingomonas TaxID=13687 RepID=UPI000834125B|nr:VOC family protein [Sphingomonas sp. CCH13-B11]